MAQQCTRCNGTGKVNCQACSKEKDPKITTRDWASCARCDGTGTIQCPACNGSGSK